MEEVVQVLVILLVVNSVLVVVQVVVKIVVAVIVAILVLKKKGVYNINEWFRYIRIKNFNARKGDNTR